MKRLLKPIALLGALAGSAHAVLIASGDGSGNTAAPPDDPGFAHIGVLYSASAVYLGNRWVMTAAHVAGSLPGSVQFSATSYATVSGSYQRLTNGGASGMTAQTDIALFQLASDPGLPWLSIRAGAPTVGAPMTMIGNGLDRATGITYWDGSWSELPSPSGAAYSGYKTTTDHTIRWGENLVSDIGMDLNAGMGHVRSFSSIFTDGGLANEGQAVAGDSGSGVFIKNGGAWELAGMTYAVGGLTGQPDPGSNAVFGDETAIADLSFYRNQILDITSIPEPSTVLIAASFFLTTLRRRRN